MSCKCIIALMILASPVAVFAVDATWTGAVSSDFVDSGNWNPPVDLLDGTGEGLTIGAGSPNNPVFNHTLSGTTPARPNGFNTTVQANFTMIGGELFPYGNNTFNGIAVIKNGELNTRGYAYIGDGGSGTVTIDGGTFSSKYTLYIGRNSGGNGTLNVREGIVWFPSRPSISTNGGTGHIYIEEGGFCYIGGNDTSWFQGLADSGIITTAADSAIVIDYQAALDRTRITAEKIVGAALPVPWDGTEDTDITTLSWRPGTKATQSSVYFGTNPASLSFIGSTSDSTMGVPYVMSPDTPYYWKVNTTNPWGSIEGQVWSFTLVTTLKPRKMEKLDRALIAVRSGSSNYIGWRLFGTDPADIGFTVYRGSTQLNATPITGSTNYVDAAGTTSDVYSVRPVIGGQEQSASQTVSVQTNSYYSIPVQQVPGDTDWSYQINDGAVGDLDGNGDYELIIKRFTSLTKDSDEYPVIEAYRLDGIFLWRINLGPNYLDKGDVDINPIVYDLDSDGYAEVILRTCEGMTDGVGVTTGDTNGDGITDYRSCGGNDYIDAGPEFLTIFDGRTGAELTRTDYIPRVALSQWGDNYGHRADKFHMVIAYLDGHKPSLVMCRGIYGLTKLEGWNYRDGRLYKLWHFSSEEWPGFDSQGNHNLSVGDVDSDGRDEIVYGGMCVDYDGTGLYTTGQGHGDAMHLSDLDPSRPGLEVWRCVETAATGAAFTDAATGQIIFEYYNTNDVGRSCAGDIDPRYAGAEVWGSTNCPMYSCTGQAIGTSSLAMNFMIWWDSDLLRETLDHFDYVNDGLPGPWYGKIGKWDYINGQENTILAATGTLSDNWTKGNPVLSGDIMGDWREEALWRSNDNRSVRVYTTTIPTSHRIYTLMHDPQYRLAVAWQPCGYNQPPHPGFYIGEGMSDPPTPYIQLVAADPNETFPPSPDPMGWAVKPYVNGNNSIAMQATAATDLSGVEYYFDCTYGGGHDSGWQSSPVYEDTGLTAGATYTFIVKARDKSNNQNTTLTSIPASCMAENVTGLVYWDFEDGVAGEPFTDVAGGDAYGSGGSTDLIAGYLMRGWDEYTGPSFSSVTMTGSGLSVYCNGGQDGYATDTALNGWSPQTWTIEVSVNLLDISGFKTVIGRDGSSQSEPESDFYLQNNGFDNKFRINIDTVGGQRWILDGDYVPATNKWYRLAVTSDGVTLKMYLDDGDGYTEIGSLDISAQSVAANALAATNYNWTFGRGWYGGSFVDHITGYLDNIRFSNSVLTPDQFLGAPSASIPWLYGDFTGNHIVNNDDWVIFSKLWLWEDCGSLGDFDRDNDCVISLFEFGEMTENWLSAIP